MIDKRPNYASEIQLLIDEISERVMLEMLMEEAGELIQACNKLIRCNYAGNESPTPVSEAEAIRMLTEEASDLSLLLYMLGINIIRPTENPKALRWLKRLKEGDGD